MGKNKTNDLLEVRLQRKIDDLQRQLMALTSVQKVGADAIDVQRVPDDGYAQLGPLTLLPGQAVNISVTFTPPSEVLSIWNFAHSIYVDANDASHQWPSGSSLSTGQKKCDAYGWLDWGDSSDDTNVRVYKIRMQNNDTVSHDYYMRTRAYLPKLSGVHTV
jgi:hypothetical protein